MGEGGVGLVRLQHDIVPSSSLTPDCLSPRPASYLAIRLATRK